MFDTFKVKKPQRSTFSLSHKHETTVNIGDINCLHWNWCFPGDRFKIKYSFLCKFAPMIAPNFSRMRLKSEVFYVPLADIFPHFHDVIMNYKEESETVRENGITRTFNFTRMPSMMLNRFAAFANYSSAFASLPSTNLSYEEKLGYHTYFQQLSIDRLTHQIGLPFDVCCSKVTDSPTLADLQANRYCANDKYLDTQSSVANKFNITLSGCVPVSLLPFQAYQYVYNWYYRDSIRSEEVDIYPDLDSAIGTLSPWCGATANGTPSFALPFTADVNRFFNSLFQIRKRFYRKDYFNTAVGDPTVGVDSISVPDNIVDLRKANKLQQFIEKQALAGNRIAEFIAAHWAHKADNYELGRPILISSSSQNVQISEVLQTSQTTTGTDDPSAQGSRSGVGNSYGSSNGSFFISPDYGILLINMSIVPEISYFNGTPRKLTPYRWEHFPWPEFAQIGMQPIYNFELGHYQPVASHQQVGDSYPVLEDLDIFGYAPRYSEYKMELDQVSGELATSLRYWHQSPRFTNVPNLNRNFGLIGMFDINDISTVDQSAAYFSQYYNQIFAVGSDQIVDHCQVIGMFDISVNRALPYNDMPAL